jgi:hypothetical protein
MFSHALQGMKPHHAGKQHMRCLHAMILTLHSCPLELRQLPVAFLLRNPHGV